MLQIIRLTGVIGTEAGEMEIKAKLVRQGGLGRYSESRSGRSGSRVKAFRRIRVGSWNVGSLMSKLLELVDALERHRVDIACFQETKWKVLVIRRRVGSAAPRILSKNLNGDATEVFRSRVSEGVSAQIEAISASNVNSMWNFLACIIKDATKHSLGVAMGTSKTHTARRESWWLCVEMQSKVAEKQARFIELLSFHEGNLEERLRVQERYKLAKREAKKVIAQGKEKAYEDMYKKLDSKEGANEIFRIAKAQQRRRRDLGEIYFIKDEAGRIVTDEEEFKQRWGEYFSSRFNTGEPEGHEGVMGRNKAFGPDQIPIEAWRSLGAEGIIWLTSLFNKIFTSAKMPEEWRLGDVIPIFKKKGDTERQRDVHLAFIDLEKAYDSVPRDLIWKTLIDKGESRRYIKVIRDMYNGAKTRVRTSIGNT
ncbi:retrovirus-related pol polyprotein LINE-1 [Tanacetum coccineum]